MGEPQQQSPQAQNIEPDFESILLVRLFGCSKACTLLDAVELMRHE
jgi:hypothetical protein